MPNNLIRAPKGVYDAPAQAMLAAGAIAAAKAAEQGGDDPRHAALTWVTFEETAFFSGLPDSLDRVIPVIVIFHYPQGVLDDEARALAVQLVHKAAAAAKPASDPRTVATSVIMSEVPDGTWGGSGAIVRLPDLAWGAGYKHLQHLARPPLATL